MGMYMGGGGGRGSGVGGDNMHYGLGKNGKYIFRTR